MSNKIGVLLVNLGTPASTSTSDIRQFLREFLSDRRVIRVNRFVWFLILNLFVLPFRPKKLKEAYESIWLEDGAPLFVYTRSLALQLQKDLKDENSGQHNYIVDFAMTYGQPNIVDKLPDLFSQGVSKVLIVPLYPQYSTTTTLPVYDLIEKAVDIKGLDSSKIEVINDFYNHPKYIELLAHNIQEHWNQFGRAKMLLMSYHGIPASYVDETEPYVEQCKETSRLVAKALQLDDSQWTMAYQSRFGREEWVKPYTDEVVSGLPKTGVDSINAICPGFFIDCLETVEEIAEENKAFFLDSGGEKFDYIAAPNDTKGALMLIKSLIRDNIYT